jgi:hypothetical protein
MRRGRPRAARTRSSRAFQLDIAPLAAAVQHLAQKNGAAIAKLRNEIAELMPGIGHRDRLGARRRHIAGEHRRELVRIETARIDPQSRSQRIVELDQAGLCYWRRGEPCEEMLRQARVAVGEGRDQARRASGGRWPFH